MSTEAIEKLAWQEFDSLNGCISRGQAPESYADVLAKFKAHVANLPDDRANFWTAEARRIGVKL